MPTNKETVRSPALRLDAKRTARYKKKLYEILAESIDPLKEEDGICDALERLGKQIGVERIGIVLFGPDGLTVRKSLYWSSERWIYDERAQFKSLVEYPWLMRQLRAGEIILSCDVNEIVPSAFAERDYFMQHGIRAFIARPLLERNGTLLGFWHFDDTAGTAQWDYALDALTEFETILVGLLQMRHGLEACHGMIAEKDILLNNTDTQMWYMRNPTVYGSANEAHAKFLGRSSEEMKNCDVYAVYEAKAANALAEIVLTVFAQKKQLRREVTLKNSRDKERILLVSFNPMLDEAKEVTQVICSAQDITDLKKLKKVAAANRELSALNERFMQANDEMRNANMALQHEIAERKRTEEQLAKAYGELAAVQMQIIQQEKMASIGQLAAGVAHEINNPMGFIISNLDSLKSYAQALGEFFRLQDERMRDADSAQQAHSLYQAFCESKERKKIDYLIEDSKELIQDIQEGADRVKNIVQNLRAFARVGESGSVEADLNAGLESTINIIWNELKYKAKLIKEYGALPPVRCKLDQLNQVFMNILINAAQSIETQGEIYITTWPEPEWVVVKISDTGCGMAPEVVKRIFEPFYTTKEIGQGTGLGLSVSYAIVKEHGGKIEVKSEPGHGTTFTVRIPIQ